MIYSIDILNEKDSAYTVDEWDSSTQRLATKNGFVSALLQQVTKKLNLPGYDFVSFCRWNEAGDYENAIAQQVEGPSESRPIPQHSRNLFRICNSVGDDSEDRSDDHVVVTNPYRLEESQVEQFASMWDQSKEHMKDKEGFVSAQFFEAVDQSNYYRFVSRAEWRSEDYFLKQFSGKQFKNIVQQYEDCFSICISKVIRRIN